MVMLEDRVIHVEYKTLEGEDRQMNCTLNPSLLPALKGKHVKWPDEMIAAYDVERGVWRSFYADNVIKAI